MTPIPKIISSITYIISFIWAIIIYIMKEGEYDA
jgi:hypothetical protein